jgi:hypothetical protein
MLDSNAPADKSAELQFDQIEAATQGGPTVAHRSCAACSQPLTDTFYTLGDGVICPACRDRIALPPAGSRFGRILKATVLGILLGLVGAAIWFAIRRATNYELGLIAVLVGLMVGKGVRAGSGNRGGRVYQVLAVLITYCSVAANYLPDIVEVALNPPDAAAVAGVEDGASLPATDAAGQEIASAEPAAAGDNFETAGPIAMIIGMAILLVLAFGFALALPVLAGVENLIGLLIIAFALWEAWKINAATNLPIAGPYQVGSLA